MSREQVELRKVEEALRESESRYRMTIDGLADAIHVADHHYRIILVNRTFATWLKQLGIDHDIVGKTIQEAFPFLPENVWREYQQVFETGESLVSEDTTELDGVSVFTETRKVPIVKQGKVARVITVVRDVTEQRRANELAVQSQKMLSVGGLAAGMAHEINNPLAVISQSCEILLRRLRRNTAADRRLAEQCGVDVAGVREYLERNDVFELLEGCVSGTRHVSRIMSNMLAFARSSERQFESCDLGELLERTVELLASQVDPYKKIDFRSIALCCDIEDELPEVVCQEGEIQQVLVNLLINAVQSIGAAEGIEPRIDVSLRRDGDCALISVADRGPGMDEETRRRVFEPFFTTKAEGAGTGIGLSISYFIICDHHGGAMTVESSPGRGSTFHVRLPLGN